MRVLCAGDHFVTPELMVDALRERLGPLEVVTHRSDYPHQPYRHDGPVDEWVGDVDAVGALAEGVELLVTHVAPVTAAVLDAAGPGLRAVGVTRGGPVNIDLAAATGRGVAVVNAPGRNAVATAEQAMALMLAAVRRVVPSARRLRDGGWAGDLYTYTHAPGTLAGATVGLVGLGAIGELVARMLGGFDVQIVVHDPYAGDARIRDCGGRAVGLGELLATSDVVSLHARLTAETRHLIDAAAIARMQPHAVLVNVARGELVDQPALVAAVADGRIGGAALDVFHPEPPPADDPVRRLDAVTATPHVGGAAPSAAREGVRMVADGLAALLRGGRPPNLLNPEVLG